MIKFFRRIRQRLLSENKSSKYLLYAIGEIVLVVIGILIALSINNWNEDRKSQRQLHGYLISISNNIQSDTTEINDIKNLRIQHNQAALDYMQCTFRDSMPLELITRIGPILGEQYLNVDQSGFDALKNSGYIANLQGSDIEDAILSYYSFYEEIHESETSLNNFIENMEAGLYYDDYEDVSRIYKVFFNDSRLQKNPSEQELKLALEQIYNNSKMLGIMQRVAEEEHFSVYDSLRNKGQKIVKLIEKEVNK